MSGQREDDQIGQGGLADTFFELIWRGAVLNAPISRVEGGGGGKSGPTHRKSVHRDFGAGEGRGL